VWVFYPLEFYQLYADSLRLYAAYLLDSGADILQ